jgi:hypothetical protein
VSKQQAQDTYSIAMSAFERAAEGSTQETQAVHAMALAMNAIALYDHSEVLHAAREH